MDYVSNEPNAAKLISSLRNTGYDSYTAIEDIIDNSIDAHAKEVKVYVQGTGDNLRVMVADNGFGMGEEVLDQALRLGSLTERDEVSDLGKYGMGLCTASISMAKRLEVLTNEESGYLLYAAQDLDEIAEKNKFVKTVRKPTKAEENFFVELVGSRGTLIILSKVDRLSDTNAAQFSNKLSRDLGRIFRKFIVAGTKFYVNDKEVSASDPLMLSDSKTQVYSDEEYELPKSISGKSKENIRVKIVLLPEMNDELMKELKINIHSQGFYILRNNREVADAVNLGVFTKHNDFNRLRMELSFGASLDDAMGVRFSKDGVSPGQGMSDFLKNELGGQIMSIRKLIKRTQKADPEATVDHSDSETVIAKKAKLLIVPDAQIERRSPRKNKPEQEKKEKEKDGTRTPRKTQQSPNGLGARFETSAMGREGVLYECEQEGKIIVVRWNSDHPFYDQVVLPNKGSRGIISALDYLTFALASSELKVTNDDNIELLANIKSIMSTNLRSLLS